MERIQDLQNFLGNAHSVFHATALIVEKLENAGYKRLKETNEWTLIPGGKYYVTRNDSAVIAFRVPVGAPKGFLFSASHTDRPCFKVKENGVQVNSYTRLMVERYGGVILSTWMDRPLSVAGRVMVETENGVQSKLVDFDRDLLLMPNVAPHWTRSNPGYQWNVAVDNIPLLGSKEAADKFWAELEELAGGKVVGHDLYLYIRQKSSVWGLENEFFSAAAIDDLECAWGCTRGFLDAKATNNIPVLCVFDNEEVGSGSYQGAAADFLQSATIRICEALDLDVRRMMPKSFMVSADNGHATHPNHPEYADAANTCIINGGVVVKFQAEQRYTTDGLSAAVFRKICKNAGVPVQNYCNRADMAGGSTLGRVSVSQVAVPSVDIGMAQLAMHSCYETAGVQDAGYLADAMAAYYGAELDFDGEGNWQIA